jgi:type 1 glutamine amidotransferase/nicotinamidase-related amidase
MSDLKNWVLLCLLLAIQCVQTRAADTVQLELRYQQPTSEGSNRFHRLTRREDWAPQATAVIVCDMWDSHHCVNAVRRVAEVAPRMDRFITDLRSRGVTIIHAPSGCMEAYKDHPSRLRAVQTPKSKSLPNEIANWCDRIPAEEAASYPVDQSAGGEDDDPDDHRLWAARLEAMGRNPKAPWLKQCDAIRISEKQDFISDSGEEIWSILEQNGIANVILVGVHTNMCVLGRPFGLRRLASNGKNVVLARDLTDTMYDPNAWPYVSHFSGTDLIVNHIERFVCPTISSDQVLGGHEFRFSGDQRPRLVMLVAEDEYKTEETLPKFAAQHLEQHFAVQFCFGSDTSRSEIPGLSAIDQADALLISVRRRALPTQDLQRVRDFIAKGKPVIGIRTASHAFSLRDQKAAEGLSVWPEFDAEVWGGNYVGHYGNDLKSTVAFAEGAQQHSIAAQLSLAGYQPGGSLYKTAPLAAGSHALVIGKLDGEPEHPVAWTFIRGDGGRSFYTSLGHVDDFAQPQFAALLASGIHWACGLTSPSLEAIIAQKEKYASGKGKQRK